LGKHKTFIKARQILNTIDIQCIDQRKMDLSVQLPMLNLYCKEASLAMEFL